MKSKILITVKDGMVYNILTTSLNIEIYVADIDEKENGGELFTYYESIGDGLINENEFDAEIKKHEQESFVCKL